MAVSSTVALITGIVAGTAMGVMSGQTQGDWTPIGPGGPTTTQSQALTAPQEAEQKAREESLKRRRRRARTMLTSPQGLLESETLEKKTLLGE